MCVGEWLCVCACVRVCVCVCVRLCVRARVCVIFFLLDPIGRETKTTVKVENILFVTFSYTCQLLLYIVAAPEQTFVRNVV